MKVSVSETATGLSLSRLRALTAVAEEGSYSAAARRIGISHTAVAQQIRDLERAYDIHLFDRLRGVLNPTPACLELCDIATRMQQAQRDAEHVLARRGPSGKHRLRVGLGNSMPGIAIVGRILNLHPTLTVSVESGSHQDIMAAVSRREVDVAVLPNLPVDSRFRRFPVLSQEVVAIVAPDSPLSTHKDVTLEHLATRPLVFRSSGSSTQKVVDRGFRQAGFTPEPRLTADTRDAVYEAVALGIGVGFMWRYGTYRSDTVRRIRVPEFRSTVDEVVFALADERNALTDLFFNVARQFRPETTMKT
ncbi:HTH-type transcriptional activator CmpR [Thalassovita gelatinovora]|uniref:HTH-type transcriptional activator CmpR n=2 Tax=Thalassovita gelatinovora TaxID=53501 RepID=A0A0P1FA76_THAGE|nr:LysR family transcriptional regulator [Thalassovita gelatinovora]QIZ82556.1 LysR family transcriptional regulator [Thalassovita gelatinovora]CUH65075.1 HTH-type transcriptional activator CmpR [Thalassovita gelatinovora]SEP86824.1 transcriptional regulator, LysR family [Thalassovita gelatinovora]